MNEPNRYARQHAKTKYKVQVCATLPCFMNLVKFNALKPNKDTTKQNKYTITLI